MSEKILKAGTVSTSRLQPLAVQQSETRTEKHLNECLQKISCLEAEIRDLKSSHEEDLLKARRDGVAEGQENTERLDRDRLEHLEAALQTMAGEFSRKLSELEVLSLIIVDNAFSVFVSDPSEMRTCLAREISHQVRLLEDVGIAEIIVSERDFPVEADIQELLTSNPEKCGRHVIRRSEHLEPGACEFRLMLGAASLSMSEFVLEAKSRLSRLIEGELRK